MKKSLALILLILALFSCRQNDELISNQTNAQIKIETLPATNINQVKAEISGKISSVNEEKILSYGFFINDKEKVDLRNNIGQQDFSYTGNLTLNSQYFNLEDKTKYYFVFYVKTEKEIIYGNVVNFTTLAHNAAPQSYVELSTQSQVEEFASHHYTFVSNLTIKNDVNDISSLKDLVNVGNQFSITNSKLKNLRGFESILLTGADSTGGKLTIADNQFLTSLEGLDHLEYATIFNIRNNPLLKNLTGLGSLSNVWREFALDVPSFQGMVKNFETGQFRSVNWKDSNLGDRTIKVSAYDFYITNAPNLNSMKGFIIGNLQNTLTFQLTNCPSLTNFEGIIVPYRYDYFILDNLPNLTSLKGLEAFKALNHLIIDGSPKIENMNGLNGLTEIGDLNLKNITSLKNFTGLENLKTIEYLTVNNCSFTDFSGLSNVTDVKHVFSVINCDNFTNFNELKNVKYFGHDGLGGFSVTDCDGITDLLGLNKLQYIGRLTIENNPNLTSLNGLASPVVEYLTVGNCNQLQTLSGFEKVDQVKYSVHIYNNVKLDDFCPLKRSILNVASSNFTITGNLENPTKDLIIANCN